jgi:hypothetical protein
LLADPVRAAQRRLIGADITYRHVKLTGDLLNQGGLADLPRTGDNLHEPPRFDEPLGEHGALGTPVRGLLFTHDVEYFYSTSR